MSKFYNYLNATLLGAIVLAGFAACQDEDFDVSEATLKAKAYDDAFIKQFGKPDPNQSWDFFTQSLESLTKVGGSSSGLTRAVPAGNWDTSGDGWGVKDRGSFNQPDYIKANNYAEVNKYSNLLPESKNNYTLGQTQYKLQSTGSGNFTISAIWYGGAYETWPSYDFKFYIHFEDKEPHEEVVIDEETGQPKIDPETGDQVTQLVKGDTRVLLFSGVRGNFGNPGLSADVHLDAGRQFWFELEYSQNNQPAHRFYSIGTTIEKYNYSRYSEEGHSANYYSDFPFKYDRFKYKNIDYYHIYNGPSQLLYSETQYGENDIKRYMVIGFEDAWEDLNYLDFDYNDVVLYIDGDLPVPEAKRFFAEDLVAFDWDFNDVVVDVEYRRCVLRAVGGTKPVYVSFRRISTGQWFETGELHEMMYNGNVATGNQPSLGVKDENGNYRPINVDAENGLKLNPVVVLQWPEVLSVEDLKKVGTMNDVVFHVGDYNASAMERVDLNSDVTNIQYSDPYHPNKCPAIVMGTVSTRWMKEMQLITTGYPTFYQGNNPSSDQDLANIWCNYNVVQKNLYIP